jgi:replicative DNA helicase
VDYRHHASHEISARIVASVCDVNSKRALKYGTDQSRGPGDRKNLEQVRKHIVGLHGCAGDSWISIEAAVTREHRKAPLSLVIVDYIQLMGASETKGRKNETEAQQIAQITMGAKRLAQKLKVNVLLLSQFNREVKETEEPTFQHFLGSGQIERDIDIAILLWNTQVQYEKGKNRRIKCRIAKNRGGERYGLVEMDYDPAKNRFVFVPAKVQETVPLANTQRLRLAHGLGQ